MTLPPQNLVDALGAKQHTLAMVRLTMALMGNPRFRELIEGFQAWRQSCEAQLTGPNQQDAFEQGRLKGQLHVLRALTNKTEDLEMEAKALQQDITALKGALGQTENRQHRESPPDRPRRSHPVGDDSLDEILGGLT